MYTHACTFSLARAFCLGLVSPLWGQSIAFAFGRSPFFPVFSFGFVILVKRFIWCPLAEMIARCGPQRIRMPRLSALYVAPRRFLARVVYLCSHSESTVGLSTVFRVETLGLLGVYMIVGRFVCVVRSFCSARIGLIASLAHSESGLRPFQ